MSGSHVTVSTQIPQDVFQVLQAQGLYRDALAIRSQELLAMRFYQDRVLSLGKAARLAGMGKQQFIDFLSTNQVSVINLTEDEFAAEIETVDSLSAESQV